MHVLTILAADGTGTQVVARRARSGADGGWSPERARQEFGTLALVERAGIAAPRPLCLDADGAYGVGPTILLSYLPGRPLLTPRSPARWAIELARALLTVHAVTPAHMDLTHLPFFGRQEMGGKLDRYREQVRSGEPLAREVHRVVASGLERVQWPPATLVHDDFWPGNTVWSRGHLVGIIDWATAKVGDPRADVSQCRVDLALTLGPDVADAFLAAYQAEAPEPLPDVWFFDLFRGLGALLSYEKWIPDYHDLGLTQLDTTEAGERLRAFLRQALKASVQQP
jgi:aminoglycoside phosphotransferase (APT) family kinase protein